MQEEDASINLLGYLKGGSEQFANVGEQVRCDQGKKLTYGTFYFDSRLENIPVIKISHAALHPFEYTIWEKPPEELLELATRAGVMRPAGPLLYAEADTHAFHEFTASGIRMLSKTHETISAFKQFFVQYLNDFYTKMAGWYLFSETASVIETYIYRISKAYDREVIKGLLENLMLFIGRLNYWLDALIPWNDFNELAKKNKLFCQHI
jgi:hypothetical protein